MFSTQNSQNEADDDLYSGYNQSPVNGSLAANPDDEMYATNAADYGGTTTNFQATASMTGRPLYSAAGYANSSMMNAPTTPAPGTAFTGEGSGRPMTSMNAAGFTGAPPSRKSANFDPLKMGSNNARYERTALHISSGMRCNTRLLSLTSFHRRL